ncbi:MAG: hypothetical protein WBQ73_01395, partial [Candidatus Babeliales bacterium]
IGGSSLGLKALYEILVGGKFSGEGSCFPQVFFIETVDECEQEVYKRKVVAFLLQKKRVLYLIISKSGTTLETSVNAAHFLVLLRTYQPETYRDSVIFITDADSPLWNYGKSIGSLCLYIPSAIGGRFTFFTSVTLFFLELLHQDSGQLLDGAKSMLYHCLQSSFNENPAAQMAMRLYAYYRNGFPLFDTFIFCSRLHNYGLWYRQLVAESLGKEYARDGKRVMEGITPTISMGTQDLHSMLQLYVGGPRNTITRFILMEAEQNKSSESNLALKAQEIFGYDIVQGHSMRGIMNAIVTSVLATYRKYERPFLTIHLKDMTLHTVGQLCFMNMLETVYLGALLNIDITGQPNVDGYKKQAREILAQ